MYVTVGNCQAAYLVNARHELAAVSSNLDMSPAFPSGVRCWLVEELGEREVGQAWSDRIRGCAYRLFTAAQHHAAMQDNEATALLIVHLYVGVMTRA